MKEKNGFTGKSVAKVYNGSPGCMCGCKGTYYFAKQWQTSSSADRGYAVEDNEVNDEMITKIVNTINALIAEGGYEVEITDEYVFVDTGTQYYAAYFHKED